MLSLFCQKFNGKIIWKMNKNLCVAKGCRFYNCTSKPKFDKRTARFEFGKRYICLRCNTEIKDLIKCPIEK